MCLRCNACKSHHAEGTYRGRDFPIRKCVHTSVDAPVPALYWLNPIKRDVGVEVELAYFTEPHAANPIPNFKHCTYRKVGDSSVQPAGVELNVNPLKGDNIVRGLSEMLRWLHKNEADVNSTCGYHVHIDSADLNAKEVLRVVALFQALQTQIFGTLVHAGRATNQFCAQLSYPLADLQQLLVGGSAAVVKEWFHKKLYDLHLTPEKNPSERKTILAGLRTEKQRKYNDGRRSAINVHSWMMRGTLEFRCKEGTLDPCDFLMWPQFCAAFVECAIKLKDEQLAQMLDSPPPLVQFCKTTMPPAVAKWVGMRVAEPCATPVFYATN